jgi:hypothetical protein
MDDFLTMVEHREYAKRMEDEHRRQNHRLDELEKQTAQNNKLLVSVEKLALSMENMQKEQKEQGDRLEALEARDGEMWRKVVSYIITAAIGIVVGYVFKHLGFA